MVHEVSHRCGKAIAKKESKIFMNRLTVIQERRAGQEIM